MISNHNHNHNHYHNHYHHHHHNHDRDHNHNNNINNSNNNDKIDNKYLLTYQRVRIFSYLQAYSCHAHIIEVQFINSLIFTKYCFTKGKLRFVLS